MKLVCFMTHDGPEVGVLEGGHVVPVSALDPETALVLQ